jgi:hypothetical protein
VPRSFSRRCRTPGVKSSSAWAHIAVLETAHEYLPRAVEPIIKWALLLHLLLAEPFDQFEQFGIGRWHARIECRACNQNSVGRLAKRDARAEALLVFGSIARLTVGDAHRQGAPRWANCLLDADDEAHQYEVGELSGVNHGDWVGPLYPPHACVLRECLGIRREHALILGKASQGRSQVGCARHEIANGIGERGSRSAFEAEAGVARCLRRQSQEVGELLQRSPLAYGRRLVTPRSDPPTWAGRVERDALSRGP